MAKLDSLQPQRVFHYFEEISAVPRGSENMQAIAQYCENFAVCHGLKYIRDAANNVVIYKAATKGFENAEPIILQGHLDIVCQKTQESTIDFLNDGIDIYTDGDFVRARGTTLGADNGIAVAMVLAILESDDIPHPPIEAVFTTDEEIGMLGAMQLDMSLLHSKRMINLDAEEDDTVTVSCAGGSDLRVIVPIIREKKNGTRVTITLDGLKGGHSGVEINNGRINANMLAGRLLNHIKNICDFDIIAINGGDKSNAIPNRCSIELCVENLDTFKKEFEEYSRVISREISEREKTFAATLQVCDSGEFEVLESGIGDKIIFTLLCAPNGVMEMSAEIKGLVETSLNLGILKTESDEIILHFALRSNKKSALLFLEEKLIAFFKSIKLESKTFGHYPPWEFKENSCLQALYKETYLELFSTAPKVEAIHAGLECGIFASAIDGIDCIAIGPALYDVHTVNEKLSITSTQNTLRLLMEILGKLK